MDPFIQGTPPRAVSWLKSRTLVALIYIALMGCTTEPKGPMKITVPEEGEDVVSHSVVEREAVASRAGVQHILLAWKELVDVYGSRMDHRAVQRSFSEARAEVRAIVNQLRADPGAWKRLLRTHSEDPIASGGKIYDVFPKARLSRPFKEFSLRLQVNEVAVINTRFGFHIIRRME